MKAKLANATATATAVTLQVATIVVLNVITGQRRWVISMARARFALETHFAYESEYHLSSSRVWHISAKKTILLCNFQRQPQTGLKLIFFYDFFFATIYVYIFISPFKRTSH